MKVCVIGASNIDIISSPSIPCTDKDSHPGTIQLSCGGVGRNIAENISRQGIPVSLISAVGDDVFGSYILADATSAHIDVSHTLVSQKHRTSCYNEILDNSGDLLYAISDMQVITQITPAFLESKRTLIAKSSVCVLDTNISVESLAYILKNISGPKYVLDTVSGIKAEKLRSLCGHCFFIKTNLKEVSNLCVLASHAQSTNTQPTICVKTFEESPPETINDFLVPYARVLFEQGLNMLFVSLGSHGLWYMHTTQSSPRGTIITPRSPVPITNTVGAGDAMCAGMVYALFSCKNLHVDYHTLTHEIAAYGMAASIITIQDEQTVSKTMSPDTLIHTKECYL